MKLKLIVLILVVAAVFWYCSKPKTPTPQKTIRRTTTNTSGGNTGGTGGTGGTGVTGSNGSEAIFNYYGNNTGMIVDFPSHSIVSKSVSSSQEIGVANSFIEYYVYNSDNSLVLYCKNTVSGLHPNYANAFNHNNHLPQYSVRLPVGKYRIVYKNISVEANVRQTFLFGIIEQPNNGQDQHNEVVNTGEQIEKELNIYYSATSNFKLNCNVIN